MLFAFALAFLLQQPLSTVPLGQGVSLVKVEQYAPLSLGIKTTAQGVLIADVTGSKDLELLYQKNPHTALPIASLTKLMSMMLLLEKSKGHPAMVVMMQQDEVQGEKGAQRLDVAEGEEIAWNDVVHAALVFSANNAVKALVRAQGLHEDEMVEAMNARAQTWGMQDTHLPMLRVLHLLMYPLLLI